MDRVQGESMAESFQFVLYPHNDYLPSAQDEFSASRFRVFLRGNTLELVSEMAGSTSAKKEAREMANRYAELLRGSLGVVVRAITHEELRQMLPEDIIQTGVGRQGSERLFRAIREARNQLLAEGDPTLRRCYDYLQEGSREDREALFSLYKALESIKKEFGGWEAAKAILKTTHEIQFVKGLANKAGMDVRHAPGVKDAVHPPAEADILKARECTTKVVRAYEEYLKGRGR